MSVVKFSAGSSAAKMVDYLAYGKGGDEPRFSAWSSNLGLESPDQLAKDWDMTRAEHSNEGGREYYHASFNIDPKDAKGGMMSDHEMLAIGSELAERMAPGHDHACFVHRDREHPHVHVVWNTVHAETGRKYQQGPKDLERAFAIKDEIDRSRGLSVTERAPPRDRIPDEAQRLFSREQVDRYTKAFRAWETKNGSNKL